MISRHQARSRKSIRLKGYDYSEPGSYFVTICTARMQCVFGDAQNGEMVESPLGHLAADDWRDIPRHFPHITLDQFRVMPNHIHAILVIGKRRGQTGTNGERKFGQPQTGTLSTVIGAFKAGVTFKARTSHLCSNRPLWQARFHDHIIRNDVELYRIRQYIELNPIMWEFDVANPRAKEISAQDFEHILSEKYRLTGQALYMIMDSKRINRLRLK